VTGRVSMPNMCVCAFARVCMRRFAKTVLSKLKRVAEMEEDRDKKPLRPLKQYTGF